MIYKLKDNKDSSFNLAGTLKNILEFLNYPTNLNYAQTKQRLKADETYQNDMISYYIKETKIRVTNRDGQLQAFASDIWEGLSIIEWFEIMDDSEDEYKPGYYDLVDDDCISLLN